LVQSSADVSQRTLPTGEVDPDPFESFLGISLSAEIKTLQLSKLTIDERIEYWRRRADFWARRKNFLMAQIKNWKSKRDIARIQSSFDELSIQPSGAISKKKTSSKSKLKVHQSNSGILTEQLIKKFSDVL